MKRSTIIKTYGTDYKGMTKFLLEEAHLAGLISEDAKIGIKPNLVSPTPAMFGATTHPQVVAGIIEYLQAHGFHNITILEGSWVGDKTSDAFEYCGYRTLCEEYNVPFVDTQKDTYHKVDCAGMDINICDSALSVDFLINVPVLKGHGQTKITCALKNMKGLIPNTEKRLFHRMGLHRPIAHLQKGIRQDFIVVDHICGDPELEDGGHPFQTDCVMAALDPVLVDSYVCRILGYQAEQVPYIGMAEALGIGSSDLENAVVKVYDLSSQAEAAPAASFRASDYDPFETFYSPSSHLIEIAQDVEDVDSCSSCYAALVPALLRLQNEGLLEEVRSKLPGKICIGQGHRGHTGCIGIGQCCSLFENSASGCPPKTEDIYEFLIKTAGL